MQSKKEEKQVMTSQITRPFPLSENSELVTYHSRNSTRVTRTIEDHHMTSAESHDQYQQFSEMFRAKGVTAEALVKFIQCSVWFIQTWNLCITEFLSSIVFAVNNAERIFEVENAFQMLQPTFGQVLIMMVSQGSSVSTV